MQLLGMYDSGTNLMMLGRSRTVFDNVVEEEIEHVIESFQWKLWNVSLC